MRSRDLQFTLLKSPLRQEHDTIGIRNPCKLKLGSLSHIYQRTLDRGRITRHRWSRRHLTLPKDPDERLSQLDLGEARVADVGDRAAVGILNESLAHGVLFVKLVGQAGVGVGDEAKGAIGEVARRVRGQRTAAVATAMARERDDVRGCVEGRADIRDSQEIHRSSNAIDKRQVKLVFVEALVAVDARQFAANLLAEDFLAN
ncbi:hypothetical protein HYQ46_010207 [Verticillium longisporum]|nr:hypothetical protein HYQ46_010207 [Verticillium longisporum]